MYSIMLIIQQQRKKIKDIDIVEIIYPLYLVPGCVWVPVVPLAVLDYLGGLS